MIGHRTILKDLKSLADRGALSHGYLFFGPSMVGKKLAARVFAEYLERAVIPAEAGIHASQVSILNDCTIIEPGESGSIGIDAVREVKNFLWRKPNVSSKRTLIINDAELLTAEAQNALLKITEEPPASSLLILVTSDVESLLPTIISRFQKIYFGLVAEKEIAAWLSSGHSETSAEESSWQKGRKDPSVPRDDGMIVKQSMGKPGLAWRLAHDEAFAVNIALAEKFLKSAPAARRDLIKKIIEPEDFDLRKFLDAIIMVIGWDCMKLPTSALWHKALALRDRQANFSLNPRLQLENLLS